LLPALDEQQKRRVRRKRDRHLLQVELALKEWDAWLQENCLTSYQTAMQ